MFGKTRVKMSTAQIRTLKEQYRLQHLSNEEALQIVVDKILHDPTFHRKNLPQNRTVSAQ